MLTLEEIYAIEVVQEEKMLAQANPDLRHLAMSLSSKNRWFAVYAMVQGQCTQAKQSFFNKALLDIFSIKRFQDRMFDYAIPAVCDALLSDNVPFLREVYANVGYDTTYIDEETRKPMPLTMEQMVLAGESTVFVDTILQFLKNNNDLIERNLDIIETIYLQKNAANLMRDDLDFFSALHSKDKGGCEEVLAKMVSPKIHKKRNDNPLLNQYISQPALGYAKLAWLMDVKVEVKSSLVPAELLPVNPNTKYDIPYSFLNDLIEERYL